MNHGISLKFAFLMIFPNFGFIYHIGVIWTPLLNRTPPLRNHAKMQFLCVFMWQSEVKNLFWKIEPRGSNRAYTVLQMNIREYNLQTRLFLLNLRLKNFSPKWLIEFLSRYFSYMIEYLVWIFLKWLQDLLALQIDKVKQ